MKRKWQVLIVEDEALITFDLTDMLQQMNCEVPGVINTVALGLAFLDHFPMPDGAVLDCNLGGEEVWPVAEMLLDNGVPFIFSTGRSLAEEIESRFPGIPVLTKPYTARTLETTLLPELEAGAGIPGRQREHLLGLAKPLAAEARYSRTNPLFKAARLPGG